MRRVSIFIAIVLLLGWFQGTAEARKKKRKRVLPRISNPMRLPTRGEGWVIPTTWARRGLHWGTSDLVTLLKRTAKRVNKSDPTATIYVADLSLRRGGKTPWHRSHKNGRDADLLFFALDGDGNIARPPRAMIRFGSDGWSDDGRLRFDAERNWLLIKTILTDGRARVTRIFVAQHLEDLLLDHAAQLGERDSLLRRAADVLAQPSDAPPHDDHFHVRVSPGRQRSANRM